MFSQKTEQDPNEAIKMRCKERKICSKGKQQKSKRSDEISYRQNDLRNNLSARSLNRKDKKSVHMYSRKMLTFLCVFVESGENKGVYVSPELSELTATYGSFYTPRKGHNVAPWYERQTSFIYFVDWLFQSLTRFLPPPPLPRPSAPSFTPEKERQTCPKPRTWFHRQMQEDVFDG